ncbi:MAG TPA: tRNA modification GTPase [Pirellulaceae bacterium]|nr:tRNA modification GTPase [Pirellulaceae bacterium]
MVVGDTQDTIAAVASATGGGVRGIVRLAGDQCVSVLAGCFTPECDQPSPWDVRTPRRIAGSLELGDPLGRVPADLLLWPGTRSYTRQPAAEIHTLGSPPLLDAILARLCEDGARIARPGEFTLRAFLAGRIDLTQAEAVLGVIDARDQRELSIALSQLAGGLAGPLCELRNRLLDLLAHLEAGLDFVEEDIEFISHGELAHQLDEAAGQIDALAEQMQRRGTTHALPRVVLSGPPNVGKSSLFNALCGTASALVSEQAGTTRDYVSARVACGRIEVELIDTAGIDAGETLGGIEAAAQNVAQTQAEQAALVLACSEAIRPIWRPSGSNQIQVVTKCDQSADSRPADGPIQTSSRTGQGIEELKAAIESALAAQPEGTTVVAGTAARCRESLVLAADSLRRARSSAAVGEEFVAAEVRSALDDLGRVVGAVYTDDVLDRIFSRFCIGK